MCESFGCLPSQAEDELERNPTLVFDVLAMQGYRDIKLAIERANTEDQAPKGPMANLVADTMVELLRERNTGLSTDA
jgi:hypothetical protein